MWVNEECVGAQIVTLSPPVRLNLGLNLRSALYLVIKVMLCGNWVRIYAFAVMRNPVMMPNFRLEPPQHLFCGKINLFQSNHN